jgi:hypothetical protein
MQREWAERLDRCRQYDQSKMPDWDQSKIPTYRDLRTPR